MISPLPWQGSDFPYLQLATSFTCCDRTTEESDLTCAVLSCPNLLQVPKVNSQAYFKCT